MPDRAREEPAAFTWHRLFRRYLALMIVLNLVWEVVQLPLYTLWREGTASGIAFAVLHCTGGDIIIATLALVASLLILGDAAWPRSGYWPVAGLAIAMGFLYTVYSEWMNAVTRATWAYSPLMPILPFAGIGLSPLLQWLLLPWLSFRLARRT